MSRRHRILVCFAAAAAAAFLVGCASLGADWNEAEQASAPSMIQFNYDALLPETMTIAADGIVGWQNLAPDTRAYVVFAAAYGANFRCKDLYPYFKLAGGVYRSLPVLSGMQAERVQLPCPLAPGRYEYEVWIVGQGFGAELEDIAPNQILRGILIVE